MFLLSLSLFLVIGSTAVIGRTVSRALFLSGLPAEYIPVRFLAVTVGVVATSLLYSRMASRFRAQFLIPRTTLIIIVGLLAFRLLLNTAAATSLWMLGIFYVFLEIVMALNVLQFWSFASEIFNTRQAKRLFPIVTGAGNLGSMLAGASITALVPLLGTPNLLWVMSVMLAANIALVGLLGRRQDAMHAASAPAGSTMKPSASKPQTTPHPKGPLSFSPLLSTMALIVVLITLAVNIIDYQFDLSLKRSFASNPHDVSAFLGSFYFWTGIAGLIQQLLFTGPLLRRYGIFVALLIMPISILTGSFLVLVSGAALWAVTVARSPDTVFRYTVHDTSFNLLYVPIDHQLRSRARTLIDGIFKPLTIGLAGVLFFLVNRLAGIAILPWSYLAILVVGLVVIVSLRLRSLYLKTLQDSIRRRYFDPADERVDLSDGTTIRLIQETLRQPGEPQILHALALAENIDNVDWTPDLLPLLEHESPIVRRQSLRMLRRSGSAEHAARVRRCFDDPDVNVQASAIFTYWAVCHGQALEEIRPFMKHNEPKVQSAAVSGALRYGDGAAREIARPMFEAMVSNSQESVRRSAAYALGEIPSHEGVDLLHRLLEDPDVNVRLQAVQSAGRLADIRHLPSVLALLGDSHVGAAAAEALVNYDTQLIDYLEACYSESLPDLPVRRHVPGIVARIPGTQSLRFLLARLDEPDDLARARVYIWINRLCRTGAQLTESDLAAIQQRFQAETYQAYQWAVRAASPQLRASGGLLADVYSWRKRYAVDRLLYLIAILYPQANIAQVRVHLFGEDVRRRANAIELLDTILLRQHRDVFLPLLESSPERLLKMADQIYQLRPSDLKSEFATALEMNDSWLAACTLFQLQRLQQGDISALIERGLQSSHALVHETAALAANEHFKSGQSAPKDFENGERGNLMSITTLERILLLRKVELFREIPAQELESIARLCTVSHFSPGERFISQGDAADGLYILVAGEVEVTENDLGVIDRRKAGDVIGEIGVLANTLRTATCTATTETTALYINQTDFWDLLENDSTLSVSVIRVLIPKALSYPNKRS